MRQIILVAHNLRSTHNVGSLLRTAEGLGVKRVFLTGYTPYPKTSDDDRLPHLAEKLDRQINKTALGAEKLVNVVHSELVKPVLTELKQAGYLVVALEQSKDSTPLNIFEPTDKVAIVLGREVEGLETEILAVCQQVVEIPMFGRKESYNVVQAAAMAVYHCRFYS
jgi:23S rRNA (guanosine2251-2'-O)-methyltransferase